MWRGDADAKSKPRRNKAGMEVYIPRPKRLQQSVEMAQDRDEKEVENNIEDNFEGENSSGDIQKESRHVKKCRTSEQTLHSEHCDVSANSKESIRQHKHKSRSSKQDKETPDSVGKKHKRNHKEKSDETSSENHESLKCVAGIEYDEAIVSNETWEDEMKFYDAVNQEIDSTEESEQKQNIGASKGENNHETQRCLKETIIETESEGSHNQIRGSFDGGDQVSTQDVCVSVETSNTSEAANFEEVESGPRDETIIPSMNPVIDDSSENPRKRIRSSEDGTELSDKLHEISGGSGPASLKSDALLCNVDSYSNDSGPSGVKEVDNENKILIPQNLETQADSTEINEKEQHPDDHVGEDLGTFSSGNPSSEIGNKPHIEEVNTLENSVKKKHNDTTATMETEDDGDTWDSLYADDGEALDPKLMKEV